MSNFTEDQLREKFNNGEYEEIPLVQFCKFLNERNEEILIKKKSEKRLEPSFKNTFFDPEFWKTSGMKNAQSN
jgi:hypothetical protein